MIDSRHGFSRRAVLAGLGAGAATLAMPGILRAQQMKLIGASATPPTDFISQALDVFAARLKEYGLPYLFYEDTAGGHSGDADIAQGARLQALQMSYFAQKLLGTP